jgi:hypothetical protein
MHIANTYLSSYIWAGASDGARRFALLGAAGRVFSRLSCGCRAVVVRLSCGCRAVIVRSSCGCRAVVVRLSCGHRAVVVRSSCGHRAVVAELKIFLRASKMIFNFEKRKLKYNSAQVQSLQSRANFAKMLLSLLKNF